MPAPLPSTTPSSRLSGMAVALLAALFFGASVPAAKHFGQGQHFLMVTALLYLGSGAGLALVFAGRKLLAQNWGAGLARKDWPLFAGSSLLGGCVAPALLVWGLGHASGLASSLLGGSEAAFTALIAWWFFKEHIGPLAGLALGLVVGGSLLLAWPAAPATGQTASTTTGLLAVTCAYLGWSLDNNLTRKISHNDPLLMAGLRGLVCGGLLWLLARGPGQAQLPPVAVCWQLGLTGALGYGLSLVGIIWAMRSLGAARTGAAFGAAPFFGALCAMLWLHESGSLRMGLAALLLALGLSLLGYETVRKQA